MNKFDHLLHVHLKPNPDGPADKSAEGKSAWIKSKAVKYKTAAAKITKMRAPWKLALV